MPIFDWEAESASEIIGKYFWVWWAVMVPLSLLTVTVTVLWIRLKIGRGIGVVRF
jgi:hypothetical protein